MAKLDYYPAGTFQKVLGISPEKYNMWIHRKHLTPFKRLESKNAPRGKGRKLGWSMYDMTVGLVFKSLVDAGILASIASDLAYDAVAEEYRLNQTKAIKRPLIGKKFFAVINLTDFDHVEYFYDVKKIEAKTFPTITIPVHSYFSQVIDKLFELHPEDFKPD